VRDGAAGHPGGGALGIHVNPLIIARHIRELVDTRLVYGDQSLVPMGNRPVLLTRPNFDEVSHSPLAGYDRTGVRLLWTARGAAWCRAYEATREVGAAVLRRGAKYFGAQEARCYAAPIECGGSSGQAIDDDITTLKR
jgi:hypothetical protein